GFPIIVYGRCGAAILPYTFEKSFPYRCSDKYSVQRMVRMSDTLEQYLYESNPPISRGDLLVLDSILDKLFAEIGIDVVLTKKHFLDRVNDLRNNPPIRL